MGAAGFWRGGHGLVVGLTSEVVLDPLRGILRGVFMVERAQGPGSTSSTRAIIAQLLNYKDRNCILWAAQESNRAVFENGKISNYPDCTNKVQTSRKGFMKVKAKLCAMNIRCMLLYLARLKVLHGGKSQFFERPDEVWRWLEMWDKVAPDRPERTILTVHRASGAASSDWRTRGERQMRGTAEQVVDIDTANRVEIQQDGTMAVVTPGLADGSVGTLDQGRRISLRILNFVPCAGRLLP
ncbi:hypothetical protein NDU88_007507 [Pleurodeles waltl]|uniref:Uncharacterized protein n=1 Tax=Pleurodeles waltl TaxID=8319 RepID=A0AAV7SSP4_PLEWA|nr:hypothetical protein NDU88_007507 [Pleurodeles waltl]